MRRAIGDRPGPAGGLGLSVLAGVDQLHAAELADGLEHPVADSVRPVDHGEQRLVDESLHGVERAVTEDGVGGLQREAVVERR